jgi:hypothetical protein
LKKLIYELSLTCICLLCFILSDFARFPLLTTILTFYGFFLLSIATMHKLAPTETKLYITNNNERNRVRFVLVTTLNLCLVLISIEPYILSHYKLHTPPFYWLNNNIGYAACIIFGFSFLILPVYKLLRLNGRIDKYMTHLKNKEFLQQEFEIKIFNLYRKVTLWCAKQLRRWHIPIALGGMVFVFYHCYLALISGFKTNYTYISGYASLLDLLLLSVLGILRFKKVDKSLHKNLSYILILLLVAHAVFSELRL